MKTTERLSGVWAMLAVCLLIGSAAGCAQAGDVAAAVEPGGTAPLKMQAAKLETTDTVSQYGITWTFSRKVQVGRFVTGDYYVVGPVTVAKVSPAPAGSGKESRNGSMLNPPVTTAVGYDGRIKGFDPKSAAAFPLMLKPGDSLVSSISLAERQQNQTFPNPDRRRTTETGPMRTYAVLTCLAAAAPADAFRPAYCDREKKRLHRARDVQWDRLPSVKAVPAKGVPAWAKRYKMEKSFTAEGVPTLAWLERMFERPWIDHVYGWHSRETHASESMPGYGREVGRGVSMAAMLLCCDFTRQEKTMLCHRMIQVGIDNWAIAKRGKRGSAGGWPAAGGFGNGRKFPIVFAAVMLQDPEMLQINKHADEASFGEDEHTEFGKSWTGATVRFTGQYPLIGDRQIDRGPYEHLTPDKWPGRKKTMSEGYRRCCTSICWVGQALAARMLKAEKVWDHDAFFVYVDRWMHEDDAKAVEEIKKAYPDWGNGVRQGTTVFDPWIDAMWAAYRKTLQPPPDGWKPKE